MQRSVEHILFAIPLIVLFFLLYFLTGEKIPTGALVGIIVIAVIALLIGMFGKVIGGHDWGVVGVHLPKLILILVVLGFILVVGFFIFTARPAIEGL